MKKYSLVLGALILTVLALIIVRTFIANNVSTSGVVLGNVQNQINAYRLKNSILSQQVYSLSALTNIAAKAEKIGYVDKTQEFVLSNSIPIAVKQ